MKINNYFLFCSLSFQVNLRNYCELAVCRLITGILSDANNTV